MRLSEAIRKGIPITPESQSFCGCALGAAFHVIKGRLHTDQDTSLMANEIFNSGMAGASVWAKNMGFDKQLCQYISDSHRDSRMTREQCADYAEKWEREHGLWPEKVWTLSDTRAWLDMQYKQLPREVV